jgi:hypothetical protein
VNAVRIGLQVVVALALCTTAWAGEDDGVGSMLLEQGLAQSRGRRDAPGGPGADGEDRLVPLAPSEMGWYDDKIRYFEQPDFVLYRQGEQRWARHLHKSLGLDHTWELSFTHRNRFESVSHLWRRGQMRGPRNNLPFTDDQIVERTRLRVGKNLGDFWVLLEGQDARRFFAEFREIDGPAIEDRHDVQQAFVSYTDRSTFGDPRYRTDLHVGRITFEYGGTRTIGRNVLPNATNTFDGFHLNVARGARWRGRAFYTLPVERDVDDPNESFSKRTFWGLIYENAENPWYCAEVAYLGFNDKVNPLLVNQALFGTYTGRVHRDPPRSAALKMLEGAGQFDYEVDTSYQNGHKGIRGFSAGMVHMEAGYTWNRKWYPRLSLFHDYAEGTKNPGVGKNTTWDRLFGLRDFDLGATANYGPFNRNNMVSNSIKLEMRPKDDLRFFYKHAKRNLEEARDNFVGSNITGFAALRDPTGRAGTNLGHDFEMSIQKRYGENHEAEIRWAHWWKGSFFDRLPANSGLPPGGNQDTDFILASYAMRI